MDIPLFKVHMPPEALDAVIASLKSGYIGEGTISAEFERRLAEWIGSGNLCLVDSCTSALTLALHLAGAGPGTEVIATPMTCLAANACVARFGARIRWGDVDPATGNLDPNSILKLINEHTVAIMFVDWGGQPADAEAIAGIAAQHGIRTIRDAAHALGAATNGTLPPPADFSCYSLQAVKHITTINGGALCCQRLEDAERARLLRWYGLARTGQSIAMAADTDVRELGYKMHMADPNAAIGLTQLEYVDRILARHRANAGQLESVIDATPFLDRQRTKPSDRGSYLFVTILFESSEHRELAVTYFHGRGIDTSIVHRRNDRYSAFDASHGLLPGVDSFSSRMLGIPSGWWLEPADLTLISDAIEAIGQILRTA